MREPLGQQIRLRQIVERGMTSRLVRSPLAPKITRAQQAAQRGRLRGAHRESCPSPRPCLSPLAFDMAAELVAHGREQLLAEAVLDARAEARIERGGQHIGRHGLLDRGVDRPAAFAGILDEAVEILSRSGSCASAMAVRSSSQEETTLPRRQTSAISARSRSKRSSSGRFVDACAAQDVEAFGIGLHQAVFDAVVNHLHEVARARSGRHGYSPARRADRGRRASACAEIVARPRAPAS